jgi:hypothetical protein
MSTMIETETKVHPDWAHVNLSELARRTGRARSTLQRQRDAGKPPPATPAALSADVVVFPVARQRKRSSRNKKSGIDAVAAGMSQSGACSTDATVERAADAVPRETVSHASREAPVRRRFSLAPLCIPTAILLTTTAAYFSVRGMPLVLPGDPVGIMWFAGTLEVGKLVTASALAAKWRSAPGWLRTGLICAVVALACVNAWGVHSCFNRMQSAPHTEQTADIKGQLAKVDADIQAATGLDVDLIRDRDEIDDTYKSMVDRKRFNAAEDYKKAHAAERNQYETQHEATTRKIADLKTRRTAIEGTQAKVDNATTWASLPWLGNGTIELLKMVLTLCCDPLAIMLVILAEVV